MKLSGCFPSITLPFANEATSTSHEFTMMRSCLRYSRRSLLPAAIITLCIAMIGSHLGATVLIKKERIKERVKRAAIDLTDPDSDKRFKATETLRIWAAYATDAIPVISTALTTDENDNVRANAAAILEEMGSAAKNATCSLTKALSDSSQSVRSAAAFALGNIGSAPVEARHALLSLLREQEPRTQVAAAFALRLLFPEMKFNFDEQARLSEALLLDSLSKNEGSETVRLACALGSLDRQRALSAVPELAQLAGSPNRSLAANARYALKELGRHLAEFVPEILLEASEGLLGDRILAIDAIGWLQIDSTEILSFLVENLGAADGEVRIACCRALGRMQSQASSALPALNEFIRGTNEAEERRVAAYAILDISPKTIGDLVEYLKNIDPDLAMDLRVAQIESQL
ncbi:MAG: HEAT repeat domain-containing protein [bacterium]|nr:HEAT repeat domain-containing protein [bacterium]